jgi:hypothetical protein
MATKTLRVFAEYTSTGFVPMPTLGNIDYGFTLGSTFPATTPATYQTDNPDLVVTVTAMTDFYVWIRINGQAWNPSYTRNVRVYPDSPNINNVVMNMIIATGPAGVGSYTQLVQTSNRLYFNGATTDSIYNSKFAGKTYINELNFGTAPGLATVATSGAYADLTGKPTLATVATSGLFTDLSSKPSGTAPLSYNSGTNSFVITQANTSTNGYLSSTDWNTFNNKLATPSGTTLQYVDGTGALQTFPVLASADKLVINVRNSSGVSMPKGSVVYINGATGNKPTVALSQGNSDATSAQTLGLLQTTLANNAEGNVVIVGAVTDLNTSAFTEGQQLYLSPTTAGTYTATKQYAPNHLVYVGVVSRSHVSLGVIEVKVQNGYEMDELHNVSAQSPSNNDGLFYNTTTSLWEKKSIATVLGYTPYNGTDTSIKALFSATTPLSYSNGVYGISQATTSSNGYLSSTDWNTFNGKESVLSFTTPLVRTTNTISINQASASTSGYLSSTDWNTFNNKSTTSGTITSVAMTVPTGLSIAGTPITTSGTLALSLTAGYVIPTTASATQWDSAYTNRITSLTVTGSSGSATLVSNVLNIPTYTLVGLGGQVALNGTGFVKATGTTISYDNTSYLPLSGGLMTSSIQFSDTTNLKRGIYGSMGTDDNWFVGANAGGVNQGYLEIATGDDGTEPIYATQYSGNAFTTGTVARRVTILDASGNSIFPNTLTATTLVKSGGTSSQYLMADGSVSIITNNITGAGTINELAYFTASGTIASLPVATYPSLTELSYVKGVTSAIQTQINTKQATVSLTTTGTSGAATFSSNTLNIPNYGSALSGYLPLTGGTLTGALSGTSATFSSLTVENNFNGSTWIIAKNTNTGAGAAAGLLMTNNTGDLGAISLTSTANAPSNALFIRTLSTNSLVLGSNSGQHLTIASTGAATFSSSVTASQIGIGISTLPTWTGAKYIQAGLAGSFYGDGLVYGWQTGIVANAYRTGATTWNYQNSGVFAARTEMSEINPFAVFIAPTGTAGNAITFIQAMTLTAAGYLGVGTSSPTHNLEIANPSGSVYQKINADFGIAYIGMETFDDSFRFVTAQATPIQFYTNNTERMRITSGGIVNLYSPSTNADALNLYNSSGKLNIKMGGGGGGANQSSISMYNSSNTLTIGLNGAGDTDPSFITGYLAIGTTTNSGYRLYVSGTIYATGNITANSDLTLKKNLKLIDNPIDKLMQLNGYAYQWKSDDSHQYGVIAQEVEKILPYAVSTGLDGIKGVSYNQITPLLIEGFKSHESEITILKARVKYLESKLA